MDAKQCRYTVEGVTTVWRCTQMVDHPGEHVMTAYEREPAPAALPFDQAQEP